MSRNIISRNSFIVSVILLLVLVPVLILSGCVQTAKNPPKSQPHNPSTQNTVATETVFPLKLTDFVDRTVTIKKEPQRIISLSPATTEILFALGAGDRIVGITAFDDYPADKIKGLPQVGDFQGPNIEAITALQPDLIFASKLSGKEQMEALQKSGFTVVVLEATSFQQVFDSLQLTAQITNTPENGDRMVKDLQNKFTEIHEKVQGLPKVKTYYLVDSTGNWTTGRNTFIDELITLGGGENIAGDLTGWIQYNLETLIEKNPSVILTAPHAGDPQEIMNSPGFRDTDAVKNKRVFVVSDDNMVSRPSYRIIHGLEEIARFLHPEAF
jgi:iron complex transport system substrate-binding protein